MKMARTIRLVVNGEAMRLDKYVCHACPELTRAYVQKLIGEGRVTVNDRVVKPSLKIKAGDTIIVTVPPPAPAPALTPETIPLTVVYEDDDILVVDKPAGLTVHPAPAHPAHTLVNAVLARCPEVSSVDASLRPGVVHRLDKDTSGLMVVAKNKEAHMNLAAQLKKRRVRKKYWVLVKGSPSREEGTIAAPLGRHPKDRKRMAVVPQGREAYTSYKVLKRLGKYSLIEAAPQTGRTHQIRVHFSSIGCPVAGDAVYGVRLPYLDRQFLHAFLLGFRLPTSGDYGLACCSGRWCARV